MGIKVKRNYKDILDEIYQNIHYATLNGKCMYLVLNSHASRGKAILGPDDYSLRLNEEQLMEYKAMLYKFMAEDEQFKEAVPVLEK